MKKICTVILLLIALPPAFADSPWASTTITNNTGFPLFLTSSAGNCTTTAACTSPLPVGGQQEIDFTGSNSFSLNYNLCGPNPTSCQNYVTNFGLTLDPNPPHPGQSNSNNELVKLTYTTNTFSMTYAPPPPPPPVPIPTPSNYSSIPYRGVNLSGFEFGNATPPPPLYSYPTTADAAYFVNLGVNTIRLPIEWLYLQPTLSTYNNDYDTAVQNMIAALTNQEKGVHVILDLHNYMRYSNAIVSTDPNGPHPNATDLANVWVHLANEYKNNPYVMFDLMNEPNGVGASNVVNIYNIVIQAIRNDAGAHNTLLLEGDSWTGLHSWQSSGNADAFIRGNIIDPDDNFLINVHQYFDESDGYAGNGYVACQDPSSFLSDVNAENFQHWLSQNNYKAIITEFGAQADTPPNTNCAGGIRALLNFIASNPDQFVGWTAWSGGQGWNGPSSYPLDLEPAKGSTEPASQMPTLSTFLTPLPPSK